MKVSIRTTSASSVLPRKARITYSQVIVSIRTTSASSVLQRRTYASPETALTVSIRTTSASSVLLNAQGNRIPHTLIGFHPHYICVECPAMPHLLFSRDTPLFPSALHLRRVSCAQADPLGDIGQKVSIRTTSASSVLP